MYASSAALTFRESAVCCPDSFVPEPNTASGGTPAMAVATGRAMANPPGPTTAVPVGLDAATPPMPAMDKPTGRTSAIDAPGKKMKESPARGSDLVSSLAVTSFHTLAVLSF